MTTTPAPLRISSIDELITWIPYHLGHHPDGALVLVALSRGLLLGLARVPLAAEDGRPLGLDEATAVVGQALTVFGREGGDQLLAVAFEAAAGQSTLAVAALDATVAFHDIEVNDLAVVHRGRRWLPWSRDPVDRLDGRPVGAVETCPAALHLLVDGHTPLPDRQSIRALVREDPVGAAAVRQELARIVVRGSAGPRREGRLWRALLVSGPGGGPHLTPRDRARLIASLADVHWRDAIIAWCAPGSLPLHALPDSVRAGLRRWLAAPVADERAALDRLMELARSAPDDQEVSAGICSVVGCVAWQQGNGATARDAHERALEIDPAHRLAGLGLHAIELGARPGTRPRSGSPGAAAQRPAV